MHSGWKTACVLGVLCAFPVRGWSQQFREAIEDNSYFIEEAFNQEKGVVQHIVNGYSRGGGRSFSAAFTQEWPLGSQAHQLSFTIPYEAIRNGARGIGDIAINYRYQMWDGENWCWASPRISVILPTGNEETGLGTGTTAWQANLPFSRRWSDSFITHLNAGVALVPRARGTGVSGAEVRRTLTSPFAGISGIYLLTEQFNLMCEVLHTRTQEFAPGGEVTTSGETIISPGVRWAINSGDLQIVPGVALPVTVASGASEVGIFIYVSFEHPY